MLCLFEGYLKKKKVAKYWCGEEMGSLGCNILVTTAYKKANKICDQKKRHEKVPAKSLPRKDGEDFIFGR